MLPLLLLHHLATLPGSHLHFLVHKFSCLTLLKMGDEFITGTLCMWCATQSQREQTADFPMTSVNGLSYNEGKVQDGDRITLQMAVSLVVSLIKGIFLTRQQQ